MERVDILLTNGRILTMGAAGTIERGFIAIRDGLICALGAGDPCQGALAAAEAIDLGGNAVMPGLVNAHTHAAMTLFRGLADDMPLMEWLQHYIFPAEAKLTPDWVRRGTELACLEMIAGGTTTFCDMYLFAQSVAEAAAQSGLRAVVGEVLYDFPSPSYGVPENALPCTRELIARWAGHERISIAVEPHAPYTCSPALLRQCAELAGETDSPLIIHLAETISEVDTVRQRYGKTPVAHLHDLGLLRGGLIADHVVHVTEADLDLLACHDVKVIHNPESNMKLASGAAPVPAMFRRGICVGLGTDGCASNNNLDMFAEMDTAAKLQKLVAEDPTALPAEQVLKMATTEGARALGLERVCGRLETGMAADLIVINLHQPHLTPLYDLPSHLVYCAGGADVQSTMVGGRWLMKDRHFTTLDAGAVMAAVSHIAADIHALVGD